MAMAKSAALGSGGSSTVAPPRSSSRPLSFIPSDTTVPTSRSGPVMSSADDCDDLLEDDFFRASRRGAGRGSRDIRAVLGGYGSSWTDLNSHFVKGSLAHDKVAASVNLLGSGTELVRANVAAAKANLAAASGAAIANSWRQSKLTADSIPLTSSQQDSGAAASSTSVKKVPKFDHPWIEVMKEGTLQECLALSKEGPHRFGRGEGTPEQPVKFRTDHLSCSRLHANIEGYRDYTREELNKGVHGVRKGLCFRLMDLGSVHGTTLNGGKLPGYVWKVLEDGDEIQFGFSSRVYVFREPQKTPTDADNAAQSAKRGNAYNKTKQEEPRKNPWRNSDGDDDSMEDDEEAESDVQQKVKKVQRKAIGKKKKKKSLGKGKKSSNARKRKGRRGSSDDQNGSRQKRPAPKKSNR